MTPTERGLALMRKLGYTTAIVEKWNPHVKIRQDLFGCIDALGVHPAGITLGVNFTTGAHVAAHLDKCRAEPRLVTWLQAGNQFEVWGWVKHKPRGKREKWECRRLKAVLNPPTHVAEATLGLLPTDARVLPWATFEELPL